ncbi:coiled-coil domain-containing protein 78 [Tachyglossus aculeatus]|uniref:coiled-coil domain-containing protein 78 n=1 Tax=Tachyglossus aculeatus TaxID=9261 RepID=UPI0018F54B6F|nr:coiled-coil domain-containing protein 78 [Tachyglossus aculeatus]
MWSHVVPCGEEVGIRRGRPGGRPQARPADPGPGRALETGPAGPRGPDEERQLKVSRDLINLQLETNRVRERHEAETFELKCQILALETRERAARQRLRAAEPTRPHGRPEEEHHRAPEPEQPGEAQKQEKSLLRGRELLWAEMEKMRGLPGAQRRKPEETAAQRERELREARSVADSARQQLAEQSAGLLTAQGQLKEAQEENSRLQLQLKTLNDEYRGRLHHHLQSLAAFMAGPGGDAGKEEPPGRALADAMVRDIRATYRARERQLAEAARTLDRRLRGLQQRHDGLLRAYSLQQEQIQALSGSPPEPRPPEAHLPAKAPDLGRTPDDGAARVRAQLRTQEKPDGGHDPAPALPSPLDEAQWTKLQQQLRDFTRNTQAQLERERSQLLSRALLAEERLAQLQDYVERHLARYQQEIVRLRERLPPGPASGHEGPEPSGPRQ